MEEYYLESVDGIRLYCRKQGNGSPVLLVHGACTDSGYFDLLADALEATHTVYRYDRAGCGQSEERSSDCTIDMSAADLRLIADHAGRGVRVIAHSAGGAIALKMLESGAQGISGVLLFEPVIIRDLIEDQSRLGQLDEIAGFLKHSDNFARAFSMFTSTLGNEWNRAAEKDPADAMTVVKNCRTFFLNDYLPFYTYIPDYEALKGLPITVGYGDAGSGEGSHRYDASKGLARKLSCRLIGFEGAHDAPVTDAEDIIIRWEALTQ